MRFAYRDVGKGREQDAEASYLSSSYGQQLLKGCMTRAMHRNRDRCPGFLPRHCAILDDSAGTGYLATTIAHTPDIVALEPGPWRLVQPLLRTRSSCIPAE